MIVVLKVKAVVKVGPQKDGSWVLGQTIYIGDTGQQMH